MHTYTSKTIKDLVIHDDIGPNNQNKDYLEKTNEEKETIEENTDYNIDDLDVNSLHLGEVIKTIKGQNIKTTLTSNHSINVTFRTEILNETITQGEQVILTFSRTYPENKYTANKIIPLHSWNSKKHHFTGTILHENVDHIIIQFIKKLQVQYAVIKKYSLIKHQRNITVNGGEAIKFITKPKYPCTNKHLCKAIFGFIYDPAEYIPSKAFEPSETEEISKIEQFILQSKIEPYNSLEESQQDLDKHELTKEQELDLIFGPNAATLDPENLKTRNYKEDMNESSSCKKLNKRKSCAMYIPQIQKRMKK